MMLTAEDFAKIPAEEIGVEGAVRNPRVSVVMITYNHAPYIGQAIESVVSQHWPFEYELIIGVDSSTDGTDAICREFAARHPRNIRIVHSAERVGMHRNLARLWHRARGEYIALLEGDDYWSDPAKMAKQIAWLDARPDATLCGTFARIVRSNARGEESDAGIMGPRTVKERYVLEDLIPDYAFHTSTVVLRKSVVRFPDWFWSVYCADRPLYLLCAEQGPATLLPEITSVYRQHQSGIWAPTTTLHKAQQGIDLFERLAEYFGHRYDALIRRTISDILWSYVFEEMTAGRIENAKELFRIAWKYRDRRTAVRDRRAIVGTWLRLYAPRTYRTLHMLRRGVASR